MVSGSREHWEVLEGHSPTLFLVAGVLLVGYAAIHGIEAVMAVTLAPNPLQFGYVVGFLGLLGLYPVLAGRSPWLARVGVVGAVSGVVGHSAIVGYNIAELSGMLSGGPATGPVFVFLAVSGFVVGYLAVGVASLRDAAHSRTVGLLLLVPGIIVVLMTVHILAGYASPETAFVISAGEAMAHLAIGTTLRTETESSDREETESVADVTAKG